MKADRNADVAAVDHRIQEEHTIGKTVDNNMIGMTDDHVVDHDWNRGTFFLKRKLVSLIDQ